MKLNKVANFERRNVVDSLSLKDVVSFIKNPDTDHVRMVDVARKVGKSHPAYSAIKSKLPCVVPNFTFKYKYVRGKNIDRSTGYLYLDIDGNTDVDLTSPYIKAYWKSLSGNGYSIIVKVEGITKDNFKEATKSLSKDLNLPIDTKAISIDRLCIMSHDPQAYYSESCATWSYAPSDNTDKVSTTLSTLYNTIRVESVANTSKLITNTRSRILDTIDFDGDVMVDLGQKVEYAVVGSKYIKIPVGSRNASLFFTGCQLKALNTWLDMERFYTYMMTVNKDGCTVPVSEEELLKICMNVFKKYDNGDLKVINNKTCRFIFNPDYDLSPAQKRSIMMKHINKLRTQAVVDKIVNYIVETGETNNSKVSREVGVSRYSVIKYRHLAELV